MARTTVAFQGARGAFSEQACRQLLGKDLIYKPFERFVDIFDALEQKKVRYAVAPIENTLVGSIHENYDHLIQYRFPIIAETRVRIVHNLICRPEAKLSQIERAISHPVALSQCVSFFRQHPKIRAESHYDTGGSVKTVMEGDDPTVASIASAAAAEFYGGKILRKSIEDDRENYTRFFLLARKAPKQPTKDRGAIKTSIAFTTKNTSGALFRCMSALALRDMDLTKIESRPLRGRPWEYMFYVDFLGSPEDPRWRGAMNQLEEMTEHLSVLGCYPQAA